MDTAAIRLERRPQACTVRVDGLVTPALVEDLRRLSAEYPSIRCDLRAAWLSVEGANALRAWHRSAGGALEILLPDAIGAPAGAAQEPAAPVDLPALLAHEVRGPLSIAHLRLQTQSARLSARGLPEEAAACRSAIAGLEAVSRLFDTYLTASRPWVMRPVDVRAVAASAASEACEIVGRGVAEVWSEPEGAPIWASGERQALHQLLLNLVRNGLEVPCPDPGVRIEVRRADGARHIELLVADRGPGFPSDVLEAPFQPRNSQKAGGMGIGLILCKWIVDRHQGHLRLRNGEPGGQIHLRLPAAPAPGAPRD